MTTTKNSTHRFETFTVIFFLALLLAVPAWGADVRVTITDAHAEGDIVVSLCAESEYPHWRDCATQRRSARESQAPLLFTNVAPGRYAVIAYQDQNRNGRLDLRMFGPPLEPHGASNDPPPRIGPPRFRNMAFSVDEGLRDLTVVLRTQ